MPEYDSLLKKIKRVAVYEGNKCDNFYFDSTINRFIINKPLDKPKLRCITDRITM